MTEQPVGKPADPPATTIASASPLASRTFQLDVCHGDSSTTVEVTVTGALGTVLNFKAGMQIPGEVVSEAPTQVKVRQEIRLGEDDLLDEIDSVLEANAEEFVRSYVQKGGE